MTCQIPNHHHIFQKNKNHNKNIINMIFLFLLSILFIPININKKNKEQRNNTGNSIIIFQYKVPCGIMYSFHILYISKFFCLDNISF
ncbi:MAG: hypothetical protein WCG25_07770 [bacterium]